MKTFISLPDLLKERSCSFLRGVVYDMCPKKATNDLKSVTVNQSMNWESERLSQVPEKKWEFELLLLRYRVWGMIVVT